MQDVNNRRNSEKGAESVQAFLVLSEHFFSEKLKLL